jgi:hypothetical protein
MGVFLMLWAEVLLQMERRRPMSHIARGCIGASLTALLALVQPSVFGQSRRERRNARVAESAQPKKVTGGVIFQNAAAYEKTYEVILNHLKRQGQTIDSADKEVGQIITAMDIKGGYSQTGTRIQITLIKDSDTQTTVRVAVTKQKRKKALQVEPWSDPKVDDQESSKVAEEIKAALKVA